MIVIFKSHPMIFPGAQSRAQAEAGNYLKRKVQWNGLTISIENEAGTVRSGTASDGTTWQTRMLFPYGYIKRSMGVDGDQVDCYLGPNLDAGTVYVVHQRRYGDWDQYDEDKCMIGFDSQDEAVAAFLACYNDPRFLGPVSAISVPDFVAGVRATKDAPGPITGAPVAKSMLFMRRDSLS